MIMMMMMVSGQMEEGGCMSEWNVFFGTSRQTKLSKGKQCMQCIRNVKTNKQASKQQSRTYSDKLRAFHQ